MSKLDEIEARLNATTPGPWETLDGDTAVCQRDDPYAMIVSEMWQLSLISAVRRDAE